MFCCSCGAENNLQHRPGREETCADCGAYLHCCLNCIFYNETAHHQCREPQAEWVPDKKSANFCDYFKPGSTRVKSDRAKAENARKKLDDLFKS